LAAVTTAKLAAGMTVPGVSISGADTVTSVIAVIGVDMTAATAMTSLYSLAMMGATELNGELFKGNL
jgi:hypothetical protein